MTIAFSASSNTTGSSGNVSVNHTPSGTARGILVLVVSVGDGDDVASVTYGGTSLTEVTGSPVVGTGTEKGAVHAYFLGSDIPTGTQSMVVTAAGNTLTKYAVVVSMTASFDTIVDDTDTLDSLGANPALSLTATSNVFVAGAIYFGGGTGSIAPGTDFTELREVNFGLSTAHWQRRTNNASAGSVTVDWATTSDETVAIGVAIREDTAVTGTFTVSGIGAVTATAKAGRAGAGTTTGIGTVTATGVRTEGETRSGTFAITGIGSITATGKKARTGTFTVTGIGTLTATGTLDYPILGQVLIEGFGGIFVAGMGTGAGVGTDTVWDIDLTGPNGEPSSSGVAFRAATIRWTVDGPGAAEFDLRADDITADWQPGTHRVVVNLAGSPAFAGDITRLTRSGPPNNEVYRASAIGLAARLDWRLVRHAYSITDSLDSIVFSLLAEAQTQFNGNMGFTEGTVSGTLPTRTRGYCFGEVIGDAIRELATVRKGFDWEVDATGALNIWRNTRGLVTGLSLAESDVQDWAVECDTSDLLTTVSAIGDTNEPFGPRHTMARTGLATTYGRREIGIDVPSTDLDELYDAAEAELVARGGALLRVRTMWIDGLGPWGWGDVWLQDVVSVQTESVFGGTQDMRVIEVSITLDPGLQRYVEYTFEALVQDITQGDPDD